MFGDHVSGLIHSEMLGDHVSDPFSVRLSTEEVNAFRDLQLQSPSFTNDFDANGFPFSARTRVYENVPLGPVVLPVPLRLCSLAAWGVTPTIDGM